MRKLLLFIFFISCLFNSMAQQPLIGHVLDEYGNPISFVSIQQKGSKVFSSSSTDGSFHVFVEIQYDKKLIFRHSSYKNLEFDFSEKKDEPIRIVLEKRIAANRFNTRPPKPFTGAKKQWHLSLYADLMFSDYSAFEHLLGSENIDFMNRQDIAFGMELGFTKKRFYHGYTGGISFTTNTKNDSISREINKSFLGIQVGYKLIDSKRILFMPNIGVKRYKYRLVNFDKDKKIPINQFLNQRRDLDLRFSQVLGYLGANLAFKFKPKNNNGVNNGYWSLGIYGGYLFKLHPHPIIRAQRGRLTTDEKVSIKNYNFGIHLTGNIGFQRKPYQTDRQLDTSFQLQQ